MGTKCNVKHADLIAWYKHHKDPKCAQPIFIARVTRYGYSKTRAILPGDNRDGKHLLKTEVKENGRICTRCYQFKEWIHFARCRVFGFGHTTDCKDCRNRVHAERRQKEHYCKDHEYKIKKRKLHPGDMIAFMDPIVIEGIPREDTWKVIGYTHGKGYTIRSIHTRQERQLDTGDNQHNPHSINCKTFYKIIAD